MEVLNLLLAALAFVGIYSIVSIYRRYPFQPAFPWHFKLFIWAACISIILYFVIILLVHLGLISLAYCAYVFMPVAIICVASALYHHHLIAQNRVMSATMARGASIMVHAICLTLFIRYAYKYLQADKDLTLIYLYAMEMMVVLITFFVLSSLKLAIRPICACISLRFKCTNRIMD
ncbi:hypothetical protein CVU83_00020 [Candidatus Falkowbacteria bacterium HGW-Falkowbacteria-2]|uniref:Uncharacterized protein n=1 Tax=Candidatus Falkowbacteria bacterium HGW-Falkowbacteria-2 TaxID=2013769 RepID=A0A2N2E3U7_9BACT|nr:MAG: hypothetical protein CVU83_00020 [Candidatus Falkowbacteria bacterium HGW-Falkowbacteria-2]